MSLLTEIHFQAGRRCPKALWLLLRQAPQSPPPPVDHDEHRRLLRAAAPLLPGPALPLAGDQEERLRQTRQGLAQNQAMLGAAVAHGGWLAEVDCLAPHDGGGWQIVAVAPHTYVAPALLERLAFQACIAHQAGVPLTRVLALTLNPSYRRGHQLDPARLFVPHNVTSAVAARSRLLPAALDAFPTLGGAPQMPETPLGPQCEAQGDCPFKPLCWAVLPEHNIFHLHQLKRTKAFELYAAGYARLEDAPRRLRTPHREAQRYAVVTGRPFVDRPALRAFLARVEYPLHCLDFETVNAAIPWLPGLRPFDLIPVQCSLTRVASPGAKPQHETFVCTGRSDPRLPLLDRLKTGLGRRGSILAYNAAFEQAVIESLTAGNPADEPWRQSLEPRWVDLLEPFQRHLFYDRRQKGSCSLKHVLPALTGRGYEDLAIRDGHQATSAWLRLIFDHPPAEEEAKLRQDLIAYCRRDTEGLVWLLQSLQALL